MKTPSRRKWINTLVCIIVLCILLISSHKVSAVDTSTWDGDAGDGLWSNPLNWSGDILPVGANEIVIEGDVGEIHLDVGFTLGPGTLSLGSFYPSQNDTLIIDSGVTLTLDGDQNTVQLLGTGTLLNNGIIQIDAGQIAASLGTVTNNVGGVINGGVFNTSGDLSTINNNGTINDMLYRPVGGVFNNNGLWNNASIWTAEFTASTINNNVGGTINNSASAYILTRHNDDVFNNFGTLSNGGTVEIFGTFNNAGTLDNTGGTFAISCEIFTAGPIFNKVGIFTGSGTVLGNPLVEPCKIWDGDAGNGLWSDAVNWSRDSLPESTDDIFIDGRSADTVVHLDTTFTMGGVFEVRGSSSVDGFDNTFIIDSGVTLINDGSIVNRRQIFTNNGTLVNNGTFAIESHLNINDATFNNNGLLTNNGTFGNGTGFSSGTSTFNNNTGATVDNQATFENDGMIINFCGGTTINVPDVIDACPPTITTPGDLVVHAESGDSTPVTYAVTASDDVDGALTPACSPLSGAAFFLGTTVVECSATDATGNSSTVSFNITVEPPVNTDLIIESLTHLPVDPTSEDVDPMTFTAVVKNIGVSSSGPSTMNFRIGGETYGEDFAIPALAPGSSHTIVRTMHLTIPRGYATHATADVLNEVSETDETNNTAEDIFVVWDTTPPTLSVDTVSAPQDGFLPTTTIAPSSGQALGASPVQVSGTIDDNRPIALSINMTIDVNGSIVPVDDAGNWTASFMPVAGDNGVVVTATDYAGNSTADSFIVTLDFDLDEDGIRNNVDMLPDAVSADFADTALGGATSGLFTDRGEQILNVWDDIVDGVNINADITGGTSPATVSACNDSTHFTLSPGDEVQVTCGSVTIEVINGPIEVFFISSNWTEASTTLAAGDSLTFEPVTLSFTAPVYNDSTIVVLIDGIEFFIVSGATFQLAVANDDMASTQEDTSVLINVLSNDSHMNTTNVVSYTDGENGTVTTDGSTVTYSPEPDYCGSDNFTYTLNEGTSSTNTAAVDISIVCVNDAPVADANGPYLIAVNKSVTLDGSGSSDPDDDPLSVTWALDGPVLGEITGDIFTASDQAGITYVKLTIDDGRGGTATDTAMVVVYDPDGGFVTGGGWIESPVHEKYQYMQVGDRATFGFVSKYKKGASVPTGNTEFQFKAGNLNFHSDTYQWLVVNQNSTNAQFKGSGTINGEGEYRFMLWAGDGEPDTFRIKIWWEDGETENVVYDNGMDQEIGGGNIVVHTSKK